MKHLKLLFSLPLTFALVSCGESSSSAPSEELSSSESSSSSLLSSQESEVFSSLDEVISSEHSSSDEESSSELSSEETLPSKKDWNEDGVLKILEVGNSYGEDTFQYSPGILESLGVTRYVIGKMYVGGSSIDDHYWFSQNDTKTKGSYEYRKIDQSQIPNWSCTYETSLLYALEDEEWDFISLQQQSMDSTDPSTYSHFGDLLDFMEENNPYPDTKFVYNMTWAYPEDNPTPKYVETYHSNTQEMYADIVPTVAEVVQNEKRIEKILVPGTAVENARTSFLKADLFRDDLHLSYHTGRYLAGLTYFTELVDGELTQEFGYAPEYLSASQRAACIESAMNALAHKYEITPSAYPVDPEQGYHGTDVTVRLEAEDGVVDGVKAKRSGCENASGGSMACDFNDCGQGVEWIYYAPVAGEHTVEIAYWTGAPGSKMSLVLNGTSITDVVFPENTGWANGTNRPAKATATIDLVQGYNAISLFKHGVFSDSPSYGGWVQLDYLDILGNGAIYDPEALDFTAIPFTVQAEYGHFHTGGLPFACDTMEGGYAVGEINAPGHGVDFRFQVPVSGKYGLKITYAQGGNNNNATIVFNDETTSYHLLPYECQAWNKNNTSEVILESECSAEEPLHISICRANTSDWFIIDSITLVPMAN